MVVRRLLSWYGDSFGLMRAGGYGCAAALVLFALVAAWPVKVVAFIAVGFAFYMLHNSLQTQATELAPSARGSAVSMHAFSFFLGHAVGAPLFGFSHDRFGTTTAILMCAALIAAVGVTTATLLQARSEPRSA